MTVDMAKAKCPSVVNSRPKIVRHLLIAFSVQVCVQRGGWAILCAVIYREAGR